MAMSMVIEIWGFVWFSVEFSEIIGTAISPLPSWHVLHKTDSAVITVPSRLESSGVG